MSTDLTPKGAVNVPDFVKVSLVVDAIEVALVRYERIIFPLAPAARAPVLPEPAAISVPPSYVKADDPRPSYSDLVATARTNTPTVTAISAITTTSAKSETLNLRKFQTFITAT